MSKIGKKPIEIPEGVSITVGDAELTVKGPKVEIAVPMLLDVSTKQEDGVLTVTPDNEKTRARMNWGTQRSLIQNAVEGVVQEFSKTLEINGVGYRVEAGDRALTFKVGFSHPVEFKLPDGIEAKVDGNKITISGIRKDLVSQVAAQIRAIKKPEPYLGKGIKYEDEVIRRKAGKKAGTAE